MSRFRASRLASAALVLLAGSVEPAWQIGHAVAHLEIGHDTHDPATAPPYPVDPAGASLSKLPGDDGHRHPVFQAPVKPSADLVLTSAAIPSAVLRLSLDSLVVSSATFPGIPARASPSTAGTIQARAPPIVS